MIKKSLESIELAAEGRCKFYSSDPAKRCLDDAKGCESTKGQPVDSVVVKRKRAAEIRGSLLQPALQFESRPGRSRTRDQGIMSPLL